MVFFCVYVGSCFVTCGKLFATLFGLAVAALGLMLHRWHTRRALLQLDDHQLRDIGLSWEQAHTEGRKPFWRD